MVVQYGIAAMLEYFVHKKPAALVRFPCGQLCFKN